MVAKLVRIPVKDVNELAPRMKALRTKKALTMKDVASMMGVDAPYLSRLENGKVPNPTVGTLRKWAEALGLEMRFSLAVNINIQSISGVK